MEYQIIKGRPGYLCSTFRQKILVIFSAHKTSENVQKRFGSTISNVIESGPSSSPLYYSFHSLRKTKFESNANSGIF